VLERRCEDVGRDPAEITKTRMATVLIAPTHEEAQKRLQTLRDAGQGDRLEMNGLVGDPDEVAEQAQPFLDAGLDGLTFSMPQVHDLEQVALAGETLSALIGTRR
jgi:alkanesulfonate monooxygenase SsuD/methylene tetrahydromethanopterin reductase-like flavin-dependent oxidoreductase (luciferase family)